MSFSDFTGLELELLFERESLPHFSLPAPLTRAYGGALGFRRRCLFANLVASLDGVVALPGGGESGQIISAQSQPDRLVMGLLRACADAVIVGAGTFRRSPTHLWHPGVIFPPAAAEFSETRRALGLSPNPLLVLITASGDLDTSQPAARDALLVTTRRGEARLRERAPKARIVALESDDVHFSEVLSVLREEGAERVLTEGGPTLLAQLVAENVLDELFLTSSPRLFGRFAGDERKSLTHGLDLGGAPLELLSVRRHQSHLFLRYALTGSAVAP